MTWNCDECGIKVVGDFIFVDGGDIGWLCEDCKEDVDWKQYVEHYD